MTGKERIARILKHEKVDRIGLFEHFWNDTHKAWAEQGKVSPDANFADLFGFDMEECWAFNLTADLDFEPQKIAEDEDTVTLLDGNGATLRRHKFHDTTPEHIDFAIKTREDWETRIKPLLTPDPRRINFEGYRRTKEQCAKAIAEGRTPVGVLHHGLVEHIPNIQTVFLSEFLADNYKEARRELAAAGMHIVLTGHNHAQDIASVEEDGKPFYDIQTGSLVTLCPLRYIDIDSEKRTMSLESQVIDQLADGTKLFETLLEKSFWGTRRNFMQLIESNLRKMGYAGEKLEATMQMLTTLPVSHDGSYLLLDALADAYLVHRQGDESMTEKVQEVCSILQGYADLTSMSGDTATAQLLLMIKNLYAGLYVDSPSADNTLVISY